MANPGSPPRAGAVALSMDEAGHDSLSVHWSAVFAGGFVTILVYFILMSLGLGIGANSVRSAIEGEDSMQAISAGAGLWTVVSVLISLFIGSYASGRVSGIIATRVGYTQGAVITSLFFIAMITQVGFTMGTVGRGLGFVSAVAMGGSAQVARNPRVTAVVEDVLGDLNYRIPPNAVVAGVISRLIRGDTESAKSFLSSQAGISRSDAETRLAALNGKFRNTLAEVGQRGAQAATFIGWSAFVTFLLGTLAAMLGGATGALVNLRKPVDRVDLKAMQRQPIYN